MNNICHILLGFFSLPREEIVEGLLLVKWFSFVCLFAYHACCCIFNTKYKVRVVFHGISMGGIMSVVVLGNPGVPQTPR